MAEPTRTDERTRRRFARRQWARRWLTWRPVLAVVLVVLLGALLGWLVYFSSVLSVKGVQVAGLDQLDSATIRSAAAVPEGEPLATVDLDRIRTRVEALAPVRSADVSRQWPDEVLITVEERVPVAVVEIAGKLQALDEEGVAFRSYDQAPPDLPRVETGSSTGSEALREAALVAAALPADLAATIDHVEVEHRRRDHPRAARRPGGPLGERGGLRAQGQGPHRPDRRPPRRRGLRRLGPGPAHHQVALDRAWWPLLLLSRLSLLPQVHHGKQLDLHFPRRACRGK